MQQHSYSNELAKTSMARDSQGYDAELRKLERQRFILQIYRFVGRVALDVADTAVLIGALGMTVNKLDIKAWGLFTALAGGALYPLSASLIGGAELKIAENTHKQNDLSGQQPKYEWPSASDSTSMQSYIEETEFGGSSPLLLELEYDQPQITCSNQATAYADGYAAES